MLIASDGALSGDWFASDGINELGDVINAEACEGLLMAIRGRIHQEELFLDEREFDKSAQYRGVNPKPGMNLLEEYDTRDLLSQPVLEALDETLGKDWRILDRKVVCGVPDNWLPEWVRERVEQMPVPNLGAYVRPKYRHTTYFHGIDWHQDIIDWPGRPADFVTLYVYLHDVGPAECPLNVLPGSHLGGAKQFPHDVGEYRHSWQWTDPAGSVALWHPFLMHGTRPNLTDNPRYSLRYLIRSTDMTKPHALNRANARIKGAMKLDHTRRDLAADGSAQIRGNALAS